MELPDWVVDNVLVQARPTAVRLAVMLYRHGRPQVDRAGNRRLYWRGSLQALARLTGCSKRSIVDAQRELVELGLVRVHAPNRHRAPQGLSVPCGANFSPHAESEVRTHDDDQEIDRSSLSREDQVPITTTESGADFALVEELRELGVTSPEEWLRRWGSDRVDAALAYLEDRRAAGYVARNAPGLLYTWLCSGGPLPAGAGGSARDPYAKYR